MTKADGPQMSATELTMESTKDSTRTNRQDLQDDYQRPRSGLWTLDELENQDIPTLDSTFNTCTRSGSDRRQTEERRRRERIDCEDRRNGRDRRLMSYF